MQPVTKISTLRAAASAGDWNKAIAIAAKFPRLGDIRGAVLDARMAITNPRFAKQLGKDPEVLIERGIEAIRVAYL